MTSGKKSGSSVSTALLLALVVQILVPAPAVAEEILVSAAASLTDALREIGRAYDARGTNKVRFNFGPSSGLARQIDEGAPVDLFFSADLEKMDILERSGRLEAGTRKNILSNRLVLIVPADARVPIDSPEDLLKSEVKRIALAEPSSVPAGVYSKKYLEGEMLWAKIKRKIVPVLDVRAALAAVESGNVEAGFVYKTDAAISKKVIPIFEVPVEKGPKIMYPIAVIRESKRKKTARDFINFVLSPEAKETFKKYGFVVVD